MTLSTEELLSAIRRVVKDEPAPVQLHEPFFKGNEWAYVKDCLDTGWVSTVGKYVADFETRVAELSGAKYGIATVNGTAALHIALKVVGVKAGDEVLIPSLTFIATANAVSYCGAIPHFIDSNQQTLGIDPEKLDSYLLNILGKNQTNKHTGRRIAAIVPVHIFGHPVDMDAINEIAARYGIDVVEDAAESLGSWYKDRRAGCLSKIASLSFNGNKIITTGGGGAIVTNDPDLAKRAKHITTTSRIAHNWEFYHDEVGYNYRLPNINAALGVAQLENLDEFVQRKRNLAQEYSEAFKHVEGVTFFKEQPWAKSNYWLNAVLLENADLEHRNCILDSLNQAGYSCRPAWTLMHRLPMYKDCPQMDLACAIDIENRLINIPSSARLGSVNVR